MDIKPKRRASPTAKVDAEGNKLFVGDEQTATNEAARGLRSQCCSCALYPLGYLYLPVFPVLNAPACFCLQRLFVKV